MVLTRSQKEAAQSDLHTPLPTLLATLGDKEANLQDAELIGMTLCSRWKMSMTVEDRAMVRYCIRFLKGSVGSMMRTLYGDVLLKHHIYTPAEGYYSLQECLELHARIEEQIMGDTAEQRLQLACLLYDFVKERKMIERSIAIRRQQTPTNSDEFNLSVVAIKKFYSLCRGHPHFAAVLQQQYGTYMRSLAQQLDEMEDGCLNPGSGAQ